MSATQSNLIYRSEALTSSKEQVLNYIPPAAAAIIGELYFFDWMQPLFFGTVAIGLILAVIILAAHFKWPESNQHRYNLNKRKDGFFDIGFIDNRILCNGFIKQCSNHRRHRLL